jgi:hypothetical protein
MRLPLSDCLPGVRCCNRYGQGLDRPGLGCEKAKGIAAFDLEKWRNIEGLNGMQSLTIRIALVGLKNIHMPALEGVVDLHNNGGQAAIAAFTEPKASPA